MQVAKLTKGNPSFGHGRSKADLKRLTAHYSDAFNPSRFREVRYFNAPVPESIWTTACDSDAHPPFALNLIANLTHPHK